MGFIFVVDNSKQQNITGYGQGPWWKPAMQVFSEISTWILVPIVLALILGKYLDKRYDTQPVLLLVSAGLAFIFSGYGIVKTVKEFQKKVKEQEKQENK